MNSIVLKQVNCNRGYVYVIQCKSTRFVKIGMTRLNWKKRISNLQTANASELQIVYVFETSLPVDLESYLHSYFINYRIRGEWFKETVINTVEQIAVKQGCQIVERLYRKIEQC